MKYFQSLPLMLRTNDKGQRQTLINLTARASMIQSLLKNPLLFYTYDIQDGETPEIIAHRYYDNSYRYWLILFANEMLDPQWDWPLTSKDFEKYIDENFVDPYTTVKYWEKIITQYDVESQTTEENVINVDEDVYNTIVTGTQTYNLPTGQVSITTDKREVSVYQYELDTNEKKRNIKILNSAYVDEIETELVNLMSV